MLDGFAMTYSHTTMEKSLMQITVRDERRISNGRKKIEQRRI